MPFIDWQFFATVFALQLTPKKAVTPGQGEFFAGSPCIGLFWRLIPVL
jgi:hypothetical protein